MLLLSNASLEFEVLEAAFERRNFKPSFKSTNLKN